jgi:uncharacterized protein YcgI (DUF1989 family)
VSAPTSVDVVAGRTTTLQVRAGQQLEVVAAAAACALALASFVAEDHAERTSMYTSQSVNHSWRLGPGHLVMGTDSRELWTVVADTTGAIYCGGGYCAPLLDPTVTPGVEDCGAVLARDLAPLGLGPRELGPDAHLNLFQHPDYRRDGSWTVGAAATVPGDRTVLQAWQDQLVTVLACAHGPAHAGDVVARLTLHDQEDRG